ncbi:DUF2889 domain-containing protein [Rhodococcus wratislaviensis]|nr:DUF2889 domain-containing protein [Rhodococcus wratislaviensis]
MGRARDLITDKDSVAHVVGTAETHVTVDFSNEQVIKEISTVPPRPALDALVGVRAASGFRGAAAQADPDLPQAENLLNLLVDDIPVSVLISGHAMGFGKTPRQLPIVSMRSSYISGQCAGFAADATIMEEIGRSGRAPLVTGPAAPPILDNAIAWHLVDPLPPHGMRRMRRMDVIPGRLTWVDVFLRDSHMRPDGHEKIIHEYSLTVAVDPDAAIIVSCDASPRVLPWVECPAAVASARRLVGQPLKGLRAYVRQNLGGTTTCTHLNDTLRSLEDVAALLDLMP